MCLSGIFYLYIFEYLGFMGPRGDQLPVEPIAHAVISAMFDVGGQDRRLFGYGHFYWGKWTFKSSFFGIAQFSEEQGTWEGEDSNLSFFFTPLYGSLFGHVLWEWHRNDGILIHMHGGIPLACHMKYHMSMRTLDLGRWTEKNCLMMAMARIFETLRIGWFTFKSGQDWSW